MTFTRETANVIAQRFLDWNLIADVEGESVRGRCSPSGSFDEFQFPDMTIHVTASGSESRERPFSRGSNDSTPQATPRATPKPGLRASLRALSRQSGLKSITPGVKYSDRFVTSSRSHRTTESDRNTRLEQSFSGIVQSGKGAMNSGIADKHKHSESTTENDIGENTQEKEDRGLLDSLEPASLDSDATQRQTSADFDPYLMRGTGTPLSLTSAVSIDSRSAIFFESSDNFYYVCPYIGDEQDPTWSNYELFHLVEECFQKKVTADYILRIIYSRRKYDSQARAFLKSSPADVIEKIRFGTPQEEVPRCVSS
ncbi:uncharacterized protein LOC128559557 [Mercenaria mercenaria]|uniref:uncharacterized protein LOC128559557 n=1 Tax=Mercenaria mercenaria TaxID=6596 RepID=UPI00234EEC14|nr:uncharacterized protein LOC128559557 [Mercenaria mercenaria]